MLQGLLVTCGCQISETVGYWSWTWLASGSNIQYVVVMTMVILDILVRERGFAGYRTTPAFLRLGEVVDVLRVTAALFG